MNPLHKAFAGLLLASAVVCAAQAAAKAPATIRKVAVLGTGNHVEVEITGSQPLIPETQAVTGPDRLVLDFANAEPGSSLRNVAVSRGEMKAVRVGLFRANPPVTRVVLDLKSPQQYQLFPSGNTVVVKLGASPRIATAPSQPAGAAIVGTVIGGTVTEAAAPPPPAPVQPAPKCQVEFRNGNLRIWADKATLAEVLFEVHKRTGADIPIPAGAEQEQVATSLGPGPARDVLASLLNGSKFNFIMVGSDSDPEQLRSVLLSLRGSPMPQATAIYTPPPVAQASPEPEVPQPQPDQIPPDQNEDQDNPDHR